MFLAVIGTLSSGKSQVRDYYVSVHGFLSVWIEQRASSTSALPDVKISLTGSPRQFGTVGGLSTPEIKSPPLQVDAILPIPHPSVVLDNNALVFSSALDLLKYVTKNWHLNFVTTDLRTQELIKLFIRRPFFMLLSVDAPLTLRFMRSGEKSLEKFVQDNDRVSFGVDVSVSTETGTDSDNSSSLLSLRDLVNVHVFNSFRTISSLHKHLEELNLLDAEKLRPGWDAYFMTLASLASQRSNCMKRRVGAVLVRENRVVSTGYNGTPRGLRNCNEGGCATCNGTTLIPDVPVECVCLHAEENALLEAGRERVGPNAVLYCNTCPCLRCTIKIIQTGVRTVVYNLTYKVDEISALLFQEAGVELRRYNPRKDLK